MSAGKEDAFFSTGDAFLTAVHALADLMDAYLATKNACFATMFAPIKNGDVSFATVIRSTKLVRASRIEKGASFTTVDAFTNS